MFLRLKRKIIASSSTDQFTDEQLVSAYLQTGDKEMIAHLFERYTHLVYGICLNYLKDPDHSKDAVMEIFESLFQKLVAHNVINFRNWLYTVTRNHCLMIIRKAGSYNKAKTRFNVDGEEFEFPEYMSESEELMYSKAAIIAAVEHLNAEQSACIKMMYIEDKSYRDISENTGFSILEVKSHIQNGKRNLKNILTKQDGNSEK
jgi:RNA polymerase sigma-70 factor (ECF subfamily)